MERELNSIESNIKSPNDILSATFTTFNISSINPDDNKSK